MSGNDPHDNRDERFALLAHELRNPLAALANAAEILAQYAGSHTGLERVSGIVQRQTAVMRKLVEELLDVSRLDHERLAMRMSVLDLRDVARDGVADHREALAHAALDWHLALPPRAVPVRGDAVRLGQVLANLLANAIKFTPAPGSVHVRVEVQGAAALLTVRDTGIGIAPELLDAVFDRYRQASAGRSGGLGLGLPIAKGIVELHGGEITASSTGLGRGCTIAVRLPLAAAH